MTAHEYTVQGISAPDSGACISAEFTNDIILPLAPVNRDSLEGRICRKFVKHLRHVPSSQNSMKILVSIQYTADMLNCSDEHVAKILVDFGLRAPRSSFPKRFLQHMEHDLRSQNISMSIMGHHSYQELQKHWDKMDGLVKAPVNDAEHHYSNAYMVHNGY